MHLNLNQTEQMQPFLYIGLSSSFIEPETFFIALVCAEDPTLDTDKPTLIAGLIP